MDAHIEGVRVAARLLDRGDGLLAAVVVDVGRDDEPALFGDSERGGPSDPGSGAGDEYRVVLEAHNRTMAARGLNPPSCGADRGRSSGLGGG